MLIRQGDVFIAKIKKLPTGITANKLPHGTLVHGEITGHSHRLEDLHTGQLYTGTQPGEIFLDIGRQGGRIVHEEHGPIELKPGTYRVWRQREYSPEAIRHVYD